MIFVSVNWLLISSTSFMRLHIKNSKSLSYSPSNVTPGADFRPQTLLKSAVSSATPADVDHRFIFTLFGYARS